MAHPSSRGIVPKAVAQAVAKAAAINRLTPKQTTFAGLLASGAATSQADAYRKAYDVDVNGGTNITSEASKVANHRAVSAVITEGRMVAQLLHADKGAQTREKIATYLDEALDALHERQDHATLAKVAKVAGEQVHVQAFAKRAEAPEQARLTDLVAEMRTLRKELETLGFYDPQAPATLAPFCGNMQVVDSTSESSETPAIESSADPGEPTA